MKQKHKFTTILFVLLSFWSICASFAFADEDKRKIEQLENSQLDQLFLYGEFTGNFYVGKIFNQNKNIVISQITIESIPKNEKNVFNEFTPRFFNADITCKPRTMSKEFKIETGVLNPDFHTPKISEAKGYEIK